MEFPLLPPRPQNSHKRMFGHIGIIGGSPGMVGALLLAGRAALKSGAGLVSLGALNESVHVDYPYPELMFSPPDKLFAASPVSVLAIGPGLGQSRLAYELVEAALGFQAPLVIDADGLNILATHENLRNACSKRSAATLLTPHPGEASRLLGISSKAIQSSRQQSARDMASQFNAWVALKGAETVLTTPEGHIHINPTGNAALSAPGMGDVLTGMLAAFLARLDPWEALVRAVWLHGQAADDALDQGLGPEGLTATEVIDLVRKRLNTSPPGQ